MNFSRLGRSALLILGSACVFAFVGCGGKTGKVEGTVQTADGKDLPLGKISFEPPSGQPKSADITDGKYSVPGVPVGECKITISTAHIEERFKEIEHIQARIKMIEGMKPPQGTDGERDKGMQELKEMKEKIKMIEDMKAKLVKIPSKYNTSKTTPLKLDVQKGGNEFNIKLDAN